MEIKVCDLRCEMRCHPVAQSQNIFKSVKGIDKLQ